MSRRVSCVSVLHESSLRTAELLSEDSTYGREERFAVVVTC